MTLIKCFTVPKMPDAHLEVLRSTTTTAGAAAVVVEEVASTMPILSLVTLIPVLLLPTMELHPHSLALEWFLHLHILLLNSPTGCHHLHQWDMHR
jgi:hypothetical protein